MIYGPGIEPEAFQQAAVVQLVLRFKGHRKLRLTYLCVGRNMEAELKDAIEVLERIPEYNAETVRRVDIQAYIRKRWQKFKWPEGLKLLASQYPNTILATGDEDDEGDDDD